MVRRIATWIVAGAACVVGAGALAAGYDARWDWAFLLTPAVAASDSPAPLGLPGSRQHFTSAQTRDLTHAVDWRPESHAPLPDIVANGRGGAMACGYCHLPTGDGRPENSALAGLPAEYIERQIAAFADGSRQAARPGMRSTMLMAATAKAASPGAIHEAALYFSQRRFGGHVRVVEATTIPHVEPFAFVYALRPGPKEPLGLRIVEAPQSIDNFELRDPDMRFTAYVPVGSIAEGRRIALSGGPAAQPCSVCHGEGLRGGIAPPLAGRSPTAMVRQLVAFQTGTRANAEAAPMREIAAPLDERAIVALAAYAATLRP